VRISRTGDNESVLLEHGEILRCTSDGNPSPVYTWWEATTGRRLHSGQQLTFDACGHLSCAGQYVQSNVTITLQCVATVSGLHWNQSVNTSTSFFVDPGSCNHTCGTAACRHYEGWSKSFEPGYLRLYFWAQDLAADSHWCSFNIACRLLVYFSVDNNVENSRLHSVTDFNKIRYPSIHLLIRTRQQ